MSIFDKLKKSNTNLNPLVAGKKSAEISFTLLFDNTGAYVEIVDKYGATADVDYRQFSGLMRGIVRSIQLINEKSSFTIDWENTDNRIYLHEHPYLISQLLNSGLFKTGKGDLIKPESDEGQLKLVITRKDENTLSSQLILQTSENEYSNFQFVNEEFAFLTDHNNFVRTLPVGSLFYEIKSYNLADLKEADLQKYLSLYYSYVDNTSLQFEEYQVVHKTDPLKANPVLIFEKVDSDNSLYLRIGSVLPQSELDFLDEYDLLNFASINEMEKVIAVQPIEQLNTDDYISQIVKQLNKYGDKGKKKSGNYVLENNLFIIPERLASDFVYNEIPSLLKTFTLVGSEKLRDYKVNIHPPRLNLTLGHGIDFLEGTADIAFGDQSVSLIDALNQYAKNKYIVLSDGSHALVHEDYMLRLQRLFKKKKDKVEISFFDLPFIDDLIDDRIKNEQFSKAREVFEGFNNLHKKKIKIPEVRAQLRSYQQQGFQWLYYLYQNKLGGCLADDMGLGKTLQTIALLTKIYLDEKAKVPTLIVMPKSLLFNWENELKKFSPGLSYYIWYGTNRDIESARKANLVLTTYAMLRIDVEIWKEEQFLYTILDESQAIKNLNSQLHKAVMLLNAKHRLALSGTPVENNLSELYALFRFLNPAMFSSVENFNQHYLGPIQKYNNKDVSGELRRKIYPFILRRLKKDVLKELPDKIEQVLYVEMNEQQAKYYEQRRLFYKQAIEEQVAAKGIHQAQFFIFQAMNELRQIASIPEAFTDGKIASPKIETLIEQLEDALANHHKVLVFANYLAAVEHIGEELDARGIDFVTMTGSTKNRQQLVEKFQNDPACKAFILTLKTGGTGLNLTAADMVFIFDPWWNKAAENQAIDRTHRIGQEKKVMSYKLITIGTIEEKMLQLQEVKSALFENIIASDSASLKSLTESDIDFMLGN